MKKIINCSNIEAPSHLSEKSKTLWNEIVPKRGSGASRLALITIALESLDRADEARKLIAEEGLTSITKKTGAIHVNPLLKIERESKNLFVKIFNDLGLRFDHSEVEL
jgi:phage terminase small subunit